MVREREVRRLGGRSSRGNVTACLLADGLGRDEDDAGDEDG